MLINLMVKCLAIMCASIGLRVSEVGAVVHQPYVQPFGASEPGAASDEHCYRQSRCRPLVSSQCLDVTLPYKFTSNTVWENQSFVQIDNYLNKWKGLRSIPQCWKALQTVLCATFFPRCDQESNRVSLPTQEMCRRIQHPCRLIGQHHRWPEFLRCDNTTLFPVVCKNDYTDLKFNTSGVGAKCSPPLVPTEDEDIWYPGIEGCALQCQNPIYTSEEHRKVRSFISQGAGIGFVLTLFSVLTFIIDWRSSNRYPAVIIFYLNMCLMIANIGWLLGSALSKGPHEIVCRPDNTTRHGEPGNSPENFNCLFVFFLIYYFSMAALIWFINLAYAWDLSFQRSGVAHREAVNSKVAYFHLTAWSVPLMLTITIIALGEVDGDSLCGICFVGVQNPVMRTCFVLIPITVTIIIGCYYMFRAMIMLIKVKLMNKAQTNSSRNKSKEIEHMIARIGLFVIFAITGVAITYVSHVYELSNASDWKKSLNDYIICTLNMTAALYPDSSDYMSEDSGVRSCKLVDQPNLLYTYLQLMAVFGSGICASTWVWTSNSLASWKRFIVRHIRPDLNEPIRLKRHEMISKVFGRRHQLSQGVYSPSFHSVHSDPVGMNLNSAVSQDLSATWAQALPNLVYRRGAIVGNDSSNPNHYLPTYLSNTRHSSNSDVSQQRSIDSFRRSIDSQISLEQLEMAVMADRHQRRKTKKERERLLKASIRTKPYRNSRRRGSDTSSSIISAALAVRGLSKMAKSECKSISTSTRDLAQLANNPMANSMMANPYMSTIASPSAIAMPFVAPNQMPVPRLSRPVVNCYRPAFTHGMTQQSSALINPLMEKRRPDSCLPGPQSLSMDNMAVTGHVIPQPNTTPNGTQIGNNSNSNPNIQFANNFGMPFPMNGMNSAMNFMANPQSLNYYPQSMNQFYGNLMANSQVNTFGANHYMGPAYPATTPLPNIAFPSQYPPYPQYQPMTQPVQPNQHNLEDIQTLMREREAYLQLIRATDTASEMSDNFLPIQLSDSEGLYSPDLQSRNDGLLTAQELVDKHIQQVEARLEHKQTHNQTVVGALGDGTIAQLLGEGQSPAKAKTESKRKKKKSSKKSNAKKTNGNVVNNNNNNANNTDIEEQKPLMTEVSNDLNTNIEIKDKIG